MDFAAATTFADQAGRHHSSRPRAVRHRTRGEGHHGPAHAEPSPHHLRGDRGGWLRGRPPEPGAGHVRFPASRRSRWTAPARTGSATRSALWCRPRETTYGDARQTAACAQWGTLCFSRPPCPNLWGALPQHQTAAATPTPNPVPLAI